MFGNDKPTRLILVRPGATDLDDQGRIKGCLDMPLSETGWIQSETIAMELAGESIDELYCGPTQAALETADAILEGRSGTRKRVLDCLQNVDQGLWHGKLIDEVRRQLPKIYKRGHDDAEVLCPPGGETLGEAKQRVQKLVRKILRRSRGTVAIVVSDPLASVIESLLSGRAVSDLWASETNTGSWKLAESPAMS